ncbi:MAG: hypothetical protein KatS3mg111_1501 [Pirellulaceae bacterium]|nr:MAG: hypothetical protein KatS3mg111_1501 [Pirellulaceae bacterium]
MQTIKTGLVIALLLAVCYGAFVALNAPDPELPESVSEWMSEDQKLEDLVDLNVGAEVDAAEMEGAVPVSAEELMARLSQGGTAAPPPASASTETDFGSDLPAWPEVDGEAIPTAPSIEIPAVELPSLDATGGPPTSSTLPPLPAQTPAETGEPSPAISVEAFPPLQSDLVSNASGETTPSAASQEGTLIAAAGAAADSQVPATPVAYKSPSQAVPAGRADDGSTVDAAADGQPQTGERGIAVAPTKPFTQVRTEALMLAERGKLRQALELLTPFYGSPELNYEQTTDLLDLLDALSREVIYSPRHLLEPPYRVKALDTVASVAAAYHITPELLNAINGLGESKSLIPGTQIKVVRGPFRAVVFLEHSELVLFLDKLYAGRFPITIGQDPAPAPGKFSVIARQRDRTYYSRKGIAIPPGDPRNPYGDVWLSLGELAIHGTPEMASSDLAAAGCISLAPLDARDVFNILTVGSPVEIRP